MDDTEVHFASLPTEDIGDALQERIERYYNELHETGILILWRSSYNAFFKATDDHKGRLQEAGEQDEFTLISVNHYRSLLQHKSNLTIKDRPAFDPMAVNTDHRSMQQTILAKGLLDYYSKDKGMENILKQAVEFSLRYGEGYVRTVWDATAGGLYAVDPESNDPVNEGDLEYQAISPIDVIRDTAVDNPESNEWYIVRTFKNRFDLIAKYATSNKDDEDVQTELKNMREDIMTMPSKNNISRDGLTISTVGQETDLIPVYEFFHLKTPAVPEGRAITFLSSDIILTDTALPYKVIPIHPIIPTSVDGTPFGYSVAFDLLPLQQAIDGLHSAIVTNQKTFAIQMIALPKGSSLDENTLSEGLSILFYDPVNIPSGGKPEAVQLTATAPEVFNYVTQLETLMEVLSGVNKVSRGNPPASLKSGASLALIQSMAVDFASDFQNAYIRLLENVGTATIDILKTYANTERVALITGKNNKSMLQSFVGADIEAINRVTVSVGNPLSSTVAGKISILEGLIQAGLVTTPEQYLEVLQTGNLSAAVEGETAELLLIRSENEMLSEGDTDVIAIATDAHSLHIKEHKAVLASPMSRKDGNIVAATLAHIQEHINLLSETDPNLLMAIGQEPVQPAQPPQAPELAGAIAEPVGEINGVALPNMPDNPLTAQNPNGITEGIPGPDPAVI